MCKKRSIKVWLKLALFFSLKKIKNQSVQKSNDDKSSQGI
jgi:hypothetical protein